MKREKKIRLLLLVVDDTMVQGRTRCFVRCSAAHQFFSPAWCTELHVKATGGNGSSKRAWLLRRSRLACWRSASKTERTCKWFVQFLCVYVAMYVKSRGTEADREKRETLHLPECVCQSQSIWRSVLVWERGEGTGKKRVQQSNCCLKMFIFE